MNEDSEFRLATDPDTPPETLEELSRSPSETIRSAVALNENASQETLLRFVGDESSRVRENLARNKKPFEASDLRVSACKHILLSLAVIHDAEFILELRLDPSLSQYVHQVDNDLQKQRQWMLDYKQRERNRKEFYFIIGSLEGDSYGACRLYDFKEGSFSWGSWMIKRDAPSYAAIESALSVYEFAFYRLGFQRSHFDVRKANERVVRFHESFGAKRTSSDPENYYFSFEKGDYEITRARYKKFFA